MEGRMTVCNMTIEGGGRAGMIAPDETTFAYLEGRPGAARDYAEAVERLAELPSDDGRRLTPTRSTRRAIEPQVTWGTTPGMVTRSAAACPMPDDDDRPSTSAAGVRSTTWGSGRRCPRLAVDRISSARAPTRASRIFAPRPGAQGPQSRTPVAGDGGAGLEAGEGAGRGRRPGPIFTWSGLRVARGGLLDVPGHERRHPPAGRTLRVDLQPQLRRPPGQGGRTHLVSPAMAAAAAVTGRLIDVRSPDLALAGRGGKWGGGGVSRGSGGGVGV